MEEAIVSGVVSLIIFAFGYGRLHERIASLKKEYQEKIESLKKEVDHANDKVDGIHAINVTLEGMKKDIHYIKLKLDKEQE